ncbi:MAG: single-stranded DNA-binding protein [Clostridia bacterium]|nr:single-stranded DNA-binding protein [Clostridia bacterium]
MANLNLNKVILCGRLTADPELKTTPSGISVVSFTLAVNRRFRSADNNNQPQADFINIVAWRQTAEFIARYFKKGSSLCVSGNIQTRKWTDQQGQNRYATEVVVEDAMFVDSRNEGPSRDNSSANNAFGSEPYATPGAADSFDIVKNDDDLPF